MNSFQIGDKVMITSACKVRSLMGRKGVVRNTHESLHDSWYWVFVFVYDEGCEYAIESYALVKED